MHNTCLATDAVIFLGILRGWNIINETGRHIFNYLKREQLTVKK